MTGLSPLSDAVPGVYGTAASGVANLYTSSGSLGTGGCGHYGGVVGDAISVLRTGEQDVPSDEEQAAADARAKGSPFDHGAYNRYLQKQKKNEKYAGDRNK